MAALVKCKVPAPGLFLTNLQLVLLQKLQIGQTPDLPKRNEKDFPASSSIHRQATNDWVGPLDVAIVAGGNINLKLVFPAQSMLAVVGQSLGTAGTSYSHVGKPILQSNKTMGRMSNQTSVTD